MTLAATGVYAIAITVATVLYFLTGTESVLELVLFLLFVAMVAMLCAAHPKLFCIWL